MIGFTGTRKGMTERQKTSLNYLLASLSDCQFVHGGCHGADMEADSIACLILGKQ